MDDKGLKKCKKKGCNNPAIEGKYCLLCNQKRKESRDKVVKAVGGTMLGICSVAITAVLSNKKSE